MYYMDDKAMDIIIKQEQEIEYLESLVVAAIEEEVEQ